MRLEDQPERDKVIEHEGDIFISAGAGTGKSTIIAKKIVSLLKNNRVQSIRQITAITFTRKAAAELKWKIEEQIEAEINDKVENKSLGTSKSSKIPILPEQRNRLRQTLEEIEDAPIGTIHGFCAQMLRQKSLYLQIDPTFKVLSEEETSPYQRKAFEQYIKQFWEKNGDPEIKQKWIEIFELDDIDNLEQVQTILYEFDEKYYLIEQFKEENFTIKSLDEYSKQCAILYSAYVEQFKKLIAFYDFTAEASDKPDSLGAFILEVNEKLAQCENWSDAKSITQNLAIEKFHGSKKYISDDSPLAEKTAKSIKQLLYLFKGVEKGDDKLLPQLRQFTGYTGVRTRHLKDEYLRYLWYHTGTHYHKFLSELKKLQGVALYQDLIYDTYKALDNPLFLDELTAQISYIFVDEFQDTDLLQTIIFNRLHKNSVAQNHNLKVPNKICLIRVGDEKQSIYAFRGADVSSFVREKKRFKNSQEGLHANLSVNMRSHSSIVHFVNEFFNGKKINDLFKITDYEKLTAGASIVAQNAGIYIPLLDFTPDPKKVISKLDTQTYRAMEAKWIAEEIKRFREEFNSKSPEKQANKTTEKPTIAILFPALTNVNIYIEQLNAESIPVKLYGRKYYGENIPINILTLLLNIVRNPFNTTSFIGVLRSSVVALTDAEIQKLHDNNTLEVCLHTDEVQIDNSRLKQFVEKYRIMRQLYSDKPLTYLIWYIVDSCHLFQIAGMSPNKSELIQSLLTSINVAGLIDSDPLRSHSNKLSDLTNKISEMNLLSKESSYDTEKVEDDYIQIMSYHKSKGLEFDLVIMADLIHSRRKITQTVYLDTGPDSNSSPPLYQYKQSLDSCSVGIRPEVHYEQKEQEEFTRRLYVAMTRAKQRLYLPLPYTDNKTWKNAVSIKNSIKDQFDLSFAQETDFGQNVINTNTKEEISIFTEHHNIDLSQLRSQMNFTLKEIQKSQDLKIRDLDRKTADEKFPEVTEDRLSSENYMFYSGSSLMKKAIEEVTEETDNIALDKVIDSTINLINKRGNHKNEQKKLSPQIQMNNTIRSPLFQVQEKWKKCSPIELGVMAHHILEKVDLKSPSWDTEFGYYVQHSMNLNFLKPEEIAKYANELLTVYKKSQLYTIIQESKILAKEASFSTLTDTGDTAPQENVNGKEKGIAIGYIDLLIRNKSGEIIIVDYKTNRISEGSEKTFHQDLLDKYKIPMKIYETAVRQAYGEENIITGIYHTPTGDFFTYPESFESVEIPNVWS